MDSEPTEGVTQRRAGARLGGDAAVRWAAIAVGLVALAGAGAHLWYDRHTILRQATRSTERQAGLLATEIAQALDLGRIVVEGIEARIARAASADAARARVETTLADQAPVLAALPLPMTLKPVLEGDAQAIPAEPRWHPQVTREDGKGLVVPLVRPAAPNPHGMRGWSVAIDHAALVERSEASRLPLGGGAALFRIEAHGATTVLARAPRGHFDTVTQLDPVRRVVAYERVDAQGVPLVVGYGVAFDTLLAHWYQHPPSVAVSLLVLLAAGAVGARRLTRALAAQARQGDALARSERDFRTLSDNLPDAVVRFDREGRHLHANPGIERATGLPSEAFIGKTNAELGMPADKVALWTDTLRRVFTTDRSERIEFSHPGSQGERH